MCQEMLCTRKCYVLGNVMKYAMLYAMCKVKSYALCYEKSYTMCYEMLYAVCYEKKYAMIMC